MEAADATPAVTAPRFRGQSFTLGGKEYIVPPLSMKAVVDLKPELARISDADTDSPLTHLEAIARVILSALQRNYPELTYDDLGDLLEAVTMTTELLTQPTALLAELTAELAPLTARRREFTDSQAALDAAIARLTGDRAQQLLAGETVAGSSAELRRLGDDRTATADAIAILDPQIRAIEDRRTEATIRIQRIEADERYRAAVERGLAARATACAELRRFVFGRFPDLLRELRTSDAAAQDAAAAVGRLWAFAEPWPSIPVANLALGLKQASSMDAHMFGPV